MNHEKQKLKVLFVEDSEDDAELSVHQLRREGFEVVCERVDNEADLRGVLGRWQPDVILSDYSMPSFNGRAALAICQQVMPDVPFIFVSGTIGEELAIESIRNGATDYVLKNNMRRLGPSIRRAVDDSRKRRMAQALEKERSRLIAILEATSDFVMVANPDESILYLNRGGRRLLNVPGDLEGLSVSRLFSEVHWNAIRGKFHLEDGDQEIVQDHTMLVSSEGTQIPVSLVAVSHRNDAGDIEFYSFLARDIRDRRAFEKQIHFLANYDALTQMPNRTLLADRCTQALTRCQGTEQAVAMLVVDIDRFQRVNDGYGREVGDELLRQFAQRLRRNFSPRDTVARLSADSFAVLCTELNTPEDVIMPVGHLLEELTNPFHVNRRSINLSAGVGIALYPRDGIDFQTLLQNADAAMHRLKNRGQAGFQFYAAEMTQSVSEQVKLEAGLRQAIVNRELELHYQLQVSIRTQDVVGVEALMRWRHPERGLVSPGLFIPIAENSGLIEPMGEWALYTACRQLKDWERAGAPALRMAVNVSARQFRSEGFPDMVERVLTTLKLEPARLELELTESVLLEDLESAIDTLNRLHALGVQIALDDFGTGYSNLSYLSRLPIHCLKIDQSFVQRSLTDHNDTEIVRAIISLADALGMRVVAEGIETEEQLELLRQYQCGEGQGFLFARPLPAEQMFTQTPINPDGSQGMRLKK